MLPKKNKADKKAIEKIFKEGRFINSSSLTLKFLNNVHTRYGHARVSFIVPKTVEKKATRRNLLRRKGYLIFKKYWNKFPNDFIGVFIFNKIKLARQLAGRKENLLKNIEEDIKVILSKI